MACFEEATPPAIDGAQQEAVFAALADPALHGIEEPVERIDTHSAVVFLAGPFAYKVKRAVWFPFLDFSTPEKRAAACAAEVEVNRANAPGLYLSVVPIVRTPRGLALGGEGPILEHAVKMRRFDAAATLDHLAEHGPLPADLVADLARTVSAAHAAAPRHPGWDTVSRLSAYVADNAAVFAAHPDLFDPEQARALTDQSNAALARLTPLLEARSRAGFVRRCHGDLHLRNIALIDRKPVLFDAIEFSADIATCDVLYDLAFLLMDLWQKGQCAAANAILNRYLWASEDAQIEGLAALPFFISLRAAIRAKVETAGLAHLEGERLESARHHVQTSFALASDLAKPADEKLPKETWFGNVLQVNRGATWPLFLIAIGGLSGSGKSTRAAGMAPVVWPSIPPGAVILRSDIERKRLSGAAETEKLPPEAYTPAVTEKVYARLRTLAARVLAAGYCVIVDAVHARESERDAIEDVACQAGATFMGMWLEAPPEELMKRVEARTGDASDADGAVVRRQLDYDLGDIRWRRWKSPAAMSATD